MEVDEVEEMEGLLCVMITLPDDDGMRVSYLDYLHDTFKDIDLRLVKGQLIITSTNSDTIRVLNEMSEMIVDQLKQFVQIKKTTTQFMRSSHGNNNNYFEEFAIPLQLIGKAIGTGGENIRAARRLDGVVSVSNRDYFISTKGVQLFQVQAKTKEAARVARQMLVDNSITVKVPQSVMGRIIGQNGSAIQRIVNKSQVTQVMVGEHVPNSDGNATVDLTFTGSGQAVMDAKMLVEFHVRHTQKMEDARKKYEIRPAGSMHGREYYSTVNTRKIGAAGTLNRRD